MDGVAAVAAHLGHLHRLAAPGSQLEAYISYQLHQLTLVVLSQTTEIGIGAAVVSEAVSEAV